MGLHHTVACIAPVNGPVRQSMQLAGRAVWCVDEHRLNTLVMLQTGFMLYVAAFVTDQSCDT